MTYYESAEGVMITHARAMQELKNHGLYMPEILDDFYLDLGRCDTYDAQQVLQWMGY
jgi:hypothetical protein